MPGARSDQPPRQGALQQQAPRCRKCPCLHSWQLPRPHLPFLRPCPGASRLQDTQLLDCSQEEAVLPGSCLCLRPTCTCTRRGDPPPLLGSCGLRSMPGWRTRPPGCTPTRGRWWVLGLGLGPHRLRPCSSRRQQGLPYSTIPPIPPMPSCRPRPSSSTSTSFSTSRSSSTSSRGLRASCSHPRLPSLASLAQAPTSLLRDPCPHTPCRASWGPRLMPSQGHPCPCTWPCPCPCPSLANPSTPGVAPGAGWDPTEPGPCPPTCTPMEAPCTPGRPPTWLRSSG